MEGASDPLKLIYLANLLIEEKIPVSYRGDISTVISLEKTKMVHKEIEADGINKRIPYQTVSVALEITKSEQIIKDVPFA